MCSPGTRSKRVRTYLRTFDGVLRAPGVSGPAAAQLLEAGERLSVEAIAQLRGTLQLAAGRLEVAQEGLRAEGLYRSARGALDSRIRRDDADLSSRAVLRRQALQELVGVVGEPDLERPDDLVRADTVEDEHTLSPFQRDETRQHVAQLARIGEVSGMEQVVAVEEVQRRLSHAGASPRRESARRRR